jgi:hypothetical protein
LLFQVVDGLPNCANYGAFLSSMVSSFQFRERTPDNAVRFIRGIVPGEIVRGHLFYDPHSAAQLVQKNVVHYFLYRDPRDVAVSEAHYLRDMNPWHRLHRYFAALGSAEDAISLCISGFDPPIPGINFPNIGVRYARYCGWMKAEGCLAIRFEDLLSDKRPAVIRQMAEFYARASETPVDVDACAANMAARIAPQKSHTFRSGKKGGWAAEFTPEHRRLFDRVAGQLLIDFGYEPNHDWATAEVSASS